MMSKFARMEGTHDLIAKHQATIMYSLKDSDISIRKRALDLLFAMCARDNAPGIVKELLEILPTAGDDLKAEMVLKIAILAERFSPDLRW